MSVYGDSSLLSQLHYHILTFIIEYGFAPDIETLAEMLNIKKKLVIDALYTLQEEHGVILHPNRPEIWVIHPFSLAPANFVVAAGEKKWWSNCAWCSLGVGALLKQDVTITTTLGAQDDRVEIHIKNGKVIETNLLVHFPVPMRNAWENVIYTCSVMLVFASEPQIDYWCREHNICKGDVQPITRVWEFARVWYGNHLDPNWKKWTADEAGAIFKRFGLTHDIWKIPASDSRF